MLKRDDEGAQRRKTIAARKARAWYSSCLGGRYTIRNVARCWAMETGVLLREKLDNVLPFNDYFEYYGASSSSSSSWCRATHVHAMQRNARAMMLAMQCNGCIHATARDARSRVVRTQYAVAPASAAAAADEDALAVASRASGLRPCARVCATTLATDARARTHAPTH